MPTKKALKKALIGKTGSVLSMLALTSSFFLVELIVGYATNSMALVADSFHMLSDVMSLIIGYFALRYSKKSQRTERNTFGWQRAEVLGALVNAVFLIALCFSILVESLKRIVEVEPIHNVNLLLIVGAAGLFINLIGLLMFHRHGHGHSHGGHGHGHSHGLPPAAANGLVILPGEENSINHSSGSLTDDHGAKNGHVHGGEEAVSSPLTGKQTSSAQLNMRAVYLHVLGDALGSVIVMVSGFIIKYASGKWTLYVDPGMSILLVCLILRTSIPLMRESSLILLQTVPTHIKIKEVQDRLLDYVDGVLSVHEFHVWQLAGDKIIASAHITCHTPDEYMAIANQIKQFFHNEGIHSTTIQPEFVEDTLKKEECVLACGESASCAAQKCCTTEADLRKRVSSTKDESEMQDADKSSNLQHESVV
ncbi:zinc transporter 1 isoform X2 [Nematostella vectensis]|uniref:zinc transporter 1 isoform X2 n=1 Tax=Nematostella vectensis TaxID=45351 RepID=UPI00207758F7|nr:zinc transporter 1 isoform X2 [Nematostella vectensis]XP_032230524.2 zinc transporter 1 isoform X2 [Nematostella vectensis]